MYSASKEFVEDVVSPGLILAAVWDVAAYPEFVKGIKKVKMRQSDGDHALAEFTAGLAGMDFKYVLHCERDEEQVRWRRVAGSFRQAEGSMTHLGSGKFRYWQMLDPGFAVPGFAVRFVLERSLPRLIREFRERAQLLRARQGDGA